MRVTSERVCIGSPCKSFCKAVSPLCTFCKFRKNYKTKNFGRYSHTLRPFCVREKSYIYIAHNFKLMETEYFFVTTKKI